MKLAEPQPDNAMVAGGDEVFYPETYAEAEWFYVQYGAEAVNPDAFAAHFGLSPDD